MKINTIIRNFLLALLTLCVFGCGSDSGQSNKIKSEPKEQAAITTDEQLYTEASKKLVSHYMDDLVSELTMAVNAGTYESAVSVCNIKVPEITAKSSQPNWSIRRVTDRFRNPKNRADSVDLSFLASFRDSSTSSPEYLIDWTGPDSARMFRYYQPIYTSKLCLNCHGDIQTLASGVYKTIKLIYPWDKATGYKEGDLRGMFIVEAQWPEGIEYAKELVSGGTKLKQ